jgi:hypothetical protein
LDTSSDDESESTDSDSQPKADHTDDDDDDDANEPLPITRGTKRPFDVTFEDAMVLPKIKKNVDHSRQRIKANDFDDISKEILVTASSIFRCLIVTQAPFPDSIAVETRLAKEAWYEACQIKDVNVKLTPLVVKMVSSLFSTCSWSDLCYTL